MPFVVSAVVLGLLGWAGVTYWTGGRSGLPGLSGNERPAPATPQAAPVEPPRAPRGLKLPPRPAEPAPAVPTRPEAPPQPAREPAVPPPSQGETSNTDPAAAPKPEPPKTRCTADIGPWPTDKTDQGKVIQILLRDLGFYSGTTYGTVGPTTRAAIRKFQAAADEAETGEPSETLFESLKKKCASPAP